MDSMQLNRRRLLAWSAGGMVSVSLGACGGGEEAAAPGAAPAPAPATGSSSFEGNGAAGAGTAGTAVSAAQRVAALDAVSAAMAAGVSTASGGPRLDAVALARQLQALPAFHRVGVSTRMGNVWARFTDGRSLVIVNNLQPPAGATGGAVATPAAGRARAMSTRPRRQASELDLPALLVQTQYRQLDMLGQVPTSNAVEAAHLCLDWVDARTLPSLRLMALGRGLTLPPTQADGLPPDNGFDNGVDGLRNVSGDGVFFITACGAEVGASEAPTSVICTATPATEANEQKYAADLASNALVYAVSWRGNGSGWEPFSCLAITPLFPTLSRWRFPTECIGILNLTGGSVLAEWSNALRGAGLHNLFTWDKPVSWQRMLAFADDLLQIELGINTFNGRAVRQEPEPRLRAYGVGATTEYLVKRGLADDAAGGAQAVYLPEPSPTGYASVLVPTIDYATIDESDLYIELVGQFGREQGLFKAAGVRVGGSPGRPDPMLPEATAALLQNADALMSGGRSAFTLTWRGDLIQARLEPSDLSRGGYVQVVNGDRWSNLLQITFWEIPITVTSTITGGLTLQLTITLTLRADVRGYRLSPDGDRWAGAALRILGTSAESRASFTASGEISRTEGRETTTVSWSGAGGVTNPSPRNMQVQANGMLDWSARRWKPQLSVGGEASYAERRVVKRTDADGVQVTVSDTTEHQPLSFFAPAQPVPPLEFAFDERWNLLAGNHVNATEPISLLGQRTRTTTMSWGAVAASTSPVDDDDGGI